MADERRAPPGVPSMDVLEDEEAETLVKGARLIPDNWTVERPKRTTQGSRYLMLFGRIDGEFAEREPVIVAFRPPARNAWTGRAGRHYIGDDPDPLVTGTFSTVLNRLIWFAFRQNERWAAIPGFSLPERGGEA